MADRLLTTREAAEFLAVGTTSVKRWADMGLLPCVKTAGGHRRFERREVERFLRTQSFTESAPLPSMDPEIREWLDVLSVHSNEHRIESALLDARSKLGSWSETATVLGRVLLEVGHRWRSGDLSVAEEHIISERLQRGVQSVMGRLPTSRSAPACLLVSAEGDQHTIGLLLVELCAREAGWQTVWCGRNTPKSELERVLQMQKYGVVAVSASGWATDPKSLAEEAAILGQICKREGVALALGGAGQWPVPPPYGRRLSTFSDFQEMLREL